MRTTILSYREPSKFSKLKTRARRTTTIAEAARQGKRRFNISQAAAAERKLSVIGFIDLVGYSVLMQRSEAAAHGAVQTLWSLTRPLIAENGGVEIRTFGDGMLITFSGTLAATRACLQLLNALARHNSEKTPDATIHARAGIHLGDIGIQGQEIFGDGVNIAARLVNLAPPGGIAISPQVRDQIYNTLSHPIQSLGVKALKNIRTPLEVFCLPGPECTPEAISAAATAGEPAHRRWRFGVAVYDEYTHELVVGGVAVALDRNAVAVLETLLRHAGEIVTKEVLCEAAGKLSEAALSRRITKLRQALRDSEQAQIRTQAGIGYRLAVPVSVEAAPSAALTQFDFKPGDHPPLRPLWDLDKMLDQGGRGEVWLARHSKTGEKRVYKFALDPSRLSSLKREITLSRLLHGAAHNEHFIRVVDWNLDLAPFFIECEYGGSEDLLSWAKAQGGLDKVPLATRLAMLAQVADALAAAHSIGVLHKDLKPRNVLVHQPPDAEPTIKLAEFGSGGVLDTQSLHDANITDMGFTHSIVVSSGSSRGTPMYYAPELLSGQPATIQADIYALGVMLYQLVVGDLRKPLAPGWEADVDDELLREDIAVAAHGDPYKRLAGGTDLAHRLRHLEQRRAKRETQRAAEKRARLVEQAAEEAERELERLRTRRRWGGAVMLTLGVGLALALQQQQKASAEARRALAAEQKASQSAKEAQAVADFLSKDLFSVVGEKPLRDFTVRELLLAAGGHLDKRQQQLPAVAAQLHVALGNALIAVENIAKAERHLDQALRDFESAGSANSAAAVDVAAQLLHMQRRHMNRLPELLPRFQRTLAEAELALGPTNPAVLRLREQLAIARFYAGQ